MEQNKSVRKHKGGRPKKPVKKDQVLHVKCSALEMTTIKGKAKHAGYSVSRFMREIALKGQIDSRGKNVTKEILKLEFLVHNIASNINQIAKKVNTTGQLSTFWKQQLDFHLDELEKIYGKINSFFE